MNLLVVSRRPHRAIEALEALEGPCAESRRTRYGEVLFDGGILFTLRVAEFVIESWRDYYNAL